MELIFRVFAAISAVIVAAFCLFIIYIAILIVTGAHIDITIHNS